MNDYLLAHLHSQKLIFEAIIKGINGRGGNSTTLIIREGYEEGLKEINRQIEALEFDII